jgi:hypothetical protein
MELSEQYVYAVTRLLPKPQRSEVEKALRSDIQDMVDAEQGIKDERTRKVLASLGRPEKMAMNYSGTKQYLIGPEWFSTYIRALRAICSVTIVVTLIIFTVSHLSTDESIIGRITAVLVDVIGCGILAAFLTTLAFVFFEHEKAEQKNPEGVLAWSVDDLPKLPKHWSS